MANPEDFVERLRVKCSRAWPAIRLARLQAEAERLRLENAIRDAGIRLPSDISLVVFGSLARDEWTTGSDVDWTLLVDGHAESSHYRLGQEIEQTLQHHKFEPPSASGVFGKMAFSHDLIHRIGGDQDTNRITTQRVLLLLESRAIYSGETRIRVIKGILNRYLESDAGLVAEYPPRQKVPRFLLNDIVRFWRTMAVDYANKLRERSDGKWALRNVKLRMSRKLIFVSGMLNCFDVSLNPPEGLAAGKPESRLIGFLESLLRRVERTPLDIVSESLDRYAKMETAAQLLDCYDGFLAGLNQDREHLKTLTSVTSAADPVFQRFRDLGHRFQDSLTSLFFDEDPQMSALIRQYGVF